jgi:hypothetical protein
MCGILLHTIMFINTPSASRTTQETCPWEPALFSALVEISLNVNDVSPGSHSNDYADSASYSSVLHETPERGRARAGMGMVYTSPRPWLFHQIGACNFMKSIHCFLISPYVTCITAPMLTATAMLYSSPAINTVASNYFRPSIALHISRIVPVTP